jgi:hypothetical protein
MNRRETGMAAGRRRLPVVHRNIVHLLFRKGDITATAIEMVRVLSKRPSVQHQFRRLPGRTRHIYRVWIKRQSLVRVREYLGIRYIP